MISDSHGAISSSSSKKWTVTVNGKKYSGSANISISSSSKKTLASGTTTIAHNSDGKKEFSFSFSQDFGIYFGGSKIGTKSGSGKGTLDTIPRASSISSASDVVLGSSCKVKWTPKATSFKYRIKFVCGGWSATTGDIKPNTTGAYEYKGYILPLDKIAPQIPNSRTGTITATLYTYDSSTNIGSSKATFKATVPDNSSTKPSVNTVAITEIKNHSLPGDLRLANRSSLVFKIGKILKYSAKTKNYTLTVKNTEGHIEDTYTFNSDDFTLNVKSSGVKKFYLKLTDSRGFTSTEREIEGEYFFYEYAPPKINSCIVKRNKNNKENCDIIANWTSSSIKVNDVEQNTISTKIFYKKKNSPVWSNQPIELTSNDTFTTSNNLFSKGSSYDCYLEIQDKVSNPVLSDIVYISTNNVFLDAPKGGRRLGIGKVSEIADAVEVDLNAYFYKDIKYKEDTDSEWVNILDYISDTGWITVPAKGDGKISNSPGNFITPGLSSAGVIQYRRIGKQVFIKGSVKGNNLSNADAAYRTIFTLPVGFRPPTRMDFMSMGSGCNPINITIASSGQVWLTIPSRLSQNWDATYYEVLDCSFLIK